MVQKIIIKKEAIISIMSEIQKIGSVETGGILCGYYDEDTIIIKNASGPGPAAFHCIDEFIMDKDYMKQFLNEEYIKSNGLNMYIGEWHTHPQKIPKPSEQDLISMSERTLEWQHGEIVFFIVGFIDLTPNSLPNQIVAISYDKYKRSFCSIPVALEGNEKKAENKDGAPN